MQRKSKTTLLLDSTVWRQFMEDVFRFEGARAASGEIEKMLRGNDPEAFATALEAVFPRPAGGYPSLEDVERTRPRPRGEVSALIREERDARQDRVLGLERNRQALPRRKRQ